MIEKFALIMLGGALGSLARFLAATAVMERYPGRYPLGTLLVNVTGCFLIGVVMPFLSRDPAPNPNWRFLLVIGFLGGYTTFSSFAYETYFSVRSGNMAVGLLNILASVALGYGAVWLGALCVGRR